MAAPRPGEAAKHRGRRRYLQLVARVRIASTALAVLAAVAVAAPAPPAAARSKLLWATVNVCDTAGHPDGIGIRGAMPGTGDAADRLFMRFRVQFRGRGGRWRALGPAGDSGWVDAGSGRARARQAGRTFTVTPPARGGAFLLRGVVAFQWRRGGRVVRRARTRTRGGHPGTAGADPPSASAATCTVR
jgi:hypothetical protein